MALESLYDRSVTVQRLTSMFDSGQEQYQAHLSAFSCHIQPLEDSFTQDIDGSFGKEYAMYCPVLDIKEGDRVIDGATNYKVIGLKSYNFLGQNRHMEIRIRLFNP